MSFCSPIDLRSAFMSAKSFSSVFPVRADIGTQFLDNLRPFFELVFAQLFPVGAKIFAIGFDVGHEVIAVHGVFGNDAFSG